MIYKKIVQKKEGNLIITHIYRKETIKISSQRVIEYSGDVQHIDPTVFIDRVVYEPNYRMDLIRQIQQNKNCIFIPSGS